MARARLYLERSLLLRRRREDSVGIASCLESFGELEEAQGNPAKAVILLGAADRRRGRTETARPPLEKRDREEVLSKLRRALGHSSWWRTATDASLDECVALALG
jgi:hypothetical protein